jgi:peptidoglycan/xylan/chitin deacetylase (PgdA/CDA1 family)
VNTQRLKFRVKRCIGHCFAASVGRLGQSRGNLRVLTFHNVGNDESDPYSVTKDRFADCLSVLSDEGYSTIRARDLAVGWPAIASRKRLAVLTFDDGYVAQRDVAAEMLVRHGMTATFFAVSSFVERERRSREFAGGERTFLSGEDLRQMVLGGFEIGSHSHTHALLGVLRSGLVDDEMRLSRLALEEWTASEVFSFAYPFGQRGAFSSTTRSVLKINGYRTAFTQTGRRIAPGSDLLQLPRTSVDRTDSWKTFRGKLRGHYDLWERFRGC